MTVLGRGSSLIGGTLKLDLTQADVARVLLDGFFPACAFHERPRSSAKVGIRELGLSYEADPAVTRHLARFLSMGADDALPTAVLFNGGIMKAGAIRARILENAQTQSKQS